MIPSPGSGSSSPELGSSGTSPRHFSDATDGQLLPRTSAHEPADAQVHDPPLTASDDAFVSVSPITTTGLNGVSTSLAEWFQQESSAQATAVTPSCPPKQAASAHGPATANSHSQRKASSTTAAAKTARRGASASCEVSTPSRSTSAVFGSKSSHKPKVARKAGVTASLSTSAVATPDGHTSATAAKAPGGTKASPKTLGSAFDGFARAFSSSPALSTLSSASNSSWSGSARSKRRSNSNTEPASEWPFDPNAIPTMKSRRYTDDSAPQRTSGSGKTLADVNFAFLSPATSAGSANTSPQLSLQQTFTRQLSSSRSAGPCLSPRSSSGLRTVGDDIRELLDESERQDSSVTRRSIGSLASTSFQSPTSAFAMCTSAAPPPAGHYSSAEADPLLVPPMSLAVADEPSFANYHALSATGSCSKPPSHEPLFSNQQHGGGTSQNPTPASQTQTPVSNATGTSPSDFSIIFDSDSSVASSSEAVSCPLSCQAAGSPLPTTMQRGCRTGYPRPDISPSKLHAIIPSAKYKRAGSYLALAEKATAVRTASPACNPKAPDVNATRVCFRRRRYLEQLQQPRAWDKSLVTTPTKPRARSHAGSNSPSPTHFLRANHVRSSSVLASATTTQSPSRASWSAGKIARETTRSPARVSWSAADSTPPTVIQRTQAAADCSAAVPRTDSSSAALMHFLRPIIRDLSLEQHLLAFAVALQNLGILAACACGDSAAVSQNFRDATNASFSYDKAPALPLKEGGAGTSGNVVGDSGMAHCTAQVQASRAEEAHQCAVTMQQLTQEAMVQCRAQQQAQCTATSISPQLGLVSTEPFSGDDVGRMDIASRGSVTATSHQRAAVQECMQHAATCKSSIGPNPSDQTAAAFFRGLSPQLKRHPSSTPGAHQSSAVTPATSLVSTQASIDSCVATLPDTIRDCKAFPAPLPAMAFESQACSRPRLGQGPALLSQHNVSAPQLRYALLRKQHSSPGALHPFDNPFIKAPRCGSAEFIALLCSSGALGLVAAAISAPLPRVCIQACTLAGDLCRLLGEDFSSTATSRLFPQLMQNVSEFTLSSAVSNAALAACKQLVASCPSPSQLHVIMQALQTRDSKPRHAGRALLLSALCSWPWELLESQKALLQRMLQLCTQEEGRIKYSPLKGLPCVSSHELLRAFEGRLGGLAMGRQQ